MFYHDYYINQERDLMKKAQIATAGQVAKEITVNVKSLTTQVHYFMLGDAHIGNKSHFKKGFYKARKNILKIAETNPVVITFMGDMLDSIVVGDKRYAPREQVLDLSESEQELINWLKPLVDHKNVHFNGYITGNHENTLKKKGINSIATVCRSTNGKLEDYGSNCHNLIHLVCGDKKKSLRSIIMHQSPKSSLIGLCDYAKEQYAAAKARNKSAFVTLVAAGHTHSLEVLPVQRRRPCIEDEKIYEHKQWVCQTGSFLKIDFNNTNYAIEKSFTGKPIGYVEAIFSMKPLHAGTEELEVFKRFNGSIDPDSTFINEGEY